MFLVFAARRFCFTLSAMKKWRYLFLVAAGLLISADGAQGKDKDGSDVGLDQSGGKVTEQRDIEYGEVDGQKLLVDVFSPASDLAAGPQARPAVIFIHGGGWSSGDKGNFHPYARQLAEHGYVSFCISYRLMTREGKNLWPAQVDDVQRAVRWVRKNAGRFGVDPGRIAAAGGSAGGHLAALLGTTETRDNSDVELSGMSSRVDCVVNLFGPTDMADDFAPKVEAGQMVNELVRHLFGSAPATIPEVARAASPLFQVDGKSAPCITFHGCLDKLVPVDHSERLHAALLAAGVESKLVVFDDDGHGFQKPENRQRFIDETLAFLEKHLAPPGEGNGQPTGTVATGAALSPDLLRRLQTGEGDAVKVVCFGDSVTGLYYHSGGARAYTDFLRIALERLYPKAKLEMVNAGRSGHTTANGLARMEKDVLFHRPDIVTVMFGLNDLAKIQNLDTYRANLVRIVSRIRAAGGEAILCTPNSVVTTEARPFEELLKYCDVVRQVAEKLRVPLCDSFAGFEKMRAENELEWRLTLSDEIHPNAAGHKVIAEQIAATISGGRQTSLADVGPPQPAIGRTLSLLEKGSAIRVLAMPPYDVAIIDALKSLNADARVEVTPWVVDGKSLREIEKEASKLVRPLKPDLVLIAVPRAASQAADDRDAWIRSQYWLVNYSLGFGAKEWDTVVIHPSVNEPKAGERDDLERRLVAAHDLSLIDRKAGDQRDAAMILRDWFVAQGKSEGGNE